MSLEQTISKEIMAAMKHGLKVLKFFPAGVYGGAEIR